ncbi:VanZ family protein [Halorientalis sp. IM1011]|uniref:VanZ family protein n=1 Tax=Halorientalis sp. IM1011 TaxID=1932360 RepID=UPI000A077C78|nr:VanZ family protein [Halorientalis sp. IM1011]
MRPRRSTARLARVGPAVLYGVSLFAVSVADPPAGGLAPTGPLGLVAVDKWLHVLGYAALTLLIAYAVWPSTTRWLALAGALALGYGVVIEVVQAFVPSRSFSVADLGANVVGITLAAALLWAWHRRRERGLDGGLSNPE